MSSTLRSPTALAAGLAFCFLVALPGAASAQRLRMFMPGKPAIAPNPGNTSPPVNNLYPTTVNPQNFPANPPSNTGAGGGGLPVPGVNGVPGGVIGPFGPPLPIYYGGFYPPSPYPAYPAAAGFTGYALPAAGFGGFPTGNVVGQGFNGANPNANGAPVPALGGGGFQGGGFGVGMGGGAGGLPAGVNGGPANGVGGFGGFGGLGGGKGAGFGGGQGGFGGFGGFNGNQGL